MAKHPVDILPPELWEEIFDRVEDPLDWLNLYRACPSYFEEIVGKNKCIALFPKVFPHVLKYIWNGRLPLQSVLNLRLVSRGVSDLLDKQVEAVGLTGPANYQLWPYEDRFEVPDRISSFLDKFEAHPRSRNPFVGRYLVLNFEKANEDGRMGEYKQLVAQLLEEFGTHVKVLRIQDFTANLSSFDNFAHRLRNVIKLTPHLESLRLELMFYEEMIDTDNNGAVVPFAETDHDFPIIHNLKSLYSWSAGPQDDEAVRFVLEMQNMIVRMVCDPASLTTVTLDGVPSALLNCPNLQHAKFGVMMDDDDFSTLSKGPWPLSKLVVSPDSLPVDFVQFVEALGRRFKETLTKLVVIDGEDAVDDDETYQFQVDLPKLKYFRTNKMVSFDSFVNHLPSLEEISFVLNMNGDFEYYYLDEITAAFCENVRKEVERTKAWEVLPKLSKIVVDGPRLSSYYLSRGKNESQFRRFWKH